MPKIEAFFWPDYRTQRTFQPRELRRGRREAYKVQTELNGVWDIIIRKSNGARNVAYSLGSLNENHSRDDDVGTIHEAYETVRNPNRA